MTEADCQQMHQELSLMLNDLNLGWVVEQARSQLSQVPIDWDMAIEKFEGTSSQALLTKPNTLTRYELSSQKKLLDLIDTIERLVLDTGEMENELVDFLTIVSYATSETATLGFTSEGGLVETVKDSISVPGGFTNDHRQAIAELRPLLNTLRQEVESSVD